MKSNPISFRLNQDLKDALERAARDDTRSVSSIVEHILRLWLLEHGYLGDPARSKPQRKKPAG